MNIAHQHHPPLADLHSYIQRQLNSWQLEGGVMRSKIIDQSAGCSLDLGSLSPWSALLMWEHMFCGLRASRVDLSTNSRATIAMI